MADERFAPPPAPPRPMRRSRKAVYVIPSLLTTANIFCGFYSIMESLRGVSAIGLGAYSGNLLNGSINESQLPLATEHFDLAAITIGLRRCLICSMAASPA